MLCDPLSSFFQNRDKVGKKHFEKLNKELGVRDVRELAQKENREKRKIRRDLSGQLTAIASLNATVFRV